MAVGENTLKADRRIQVARILALILVIGISIYVFSLRGHTHHLARYGYPGIFILSILANATVIIPAPGVIFVFAMGAVFNPFWVAIAAGAGSAIGELTGYLAGFSGQGMIENNATYIRLRDWMASHEKLAGLVILILAFIPNPFFDIGGIAAGTLRMPVKWFLFFCWIGKTLKMLLFAYAGASVLGRFFIP